MGNSQRELLQRLQPLEQAVGNFLQETRGNVIFDLAVQEAALSETQIQPPPSRARRRTLTVAPLPGLLFHCGYCRGETDLPPAHSKTRYEIQAFGRVHRHQLQRILTPGGLVLASFKGSMAKKQK